MQNAEIAQEMHLGVGTVRHYVKEIYQIIGVRNRTEAAVYALKSGLVSLGTVSASVEPSKFQPPLSSSPELHVLEESFPGPCPLCGACDACGYDRAGRPLIHVLGAEDDV